MEFAEEVAVAYGDGRELFYKDEKSGMIMTANGRFFVNAREDDDVPGDMGVTRGVEFGVEFAEEVAVVMT